MVQGAPQAGRLAPKTGEIGPVAGQGQPPAPMAALKLARNALVMRQAQLAACRTCGVEAAAYDRAAAELDTYLKALDCA